MSLRVAEYYWGFIQDFAKPLIRMFRTEKKYSWTSEWTTTGKTLNNRLMTAPILKAPSGAEGIVIYSDGKGLKCVLRYHKQLVAYITKAF